MTTSVAYDIASLGSSGNDEEVPTHRLSAKRMTSGCRRQQRHQHYCVGESENEELRRVKVKGQGLIFFTVGLSMDSNKPGRHGGNNSVGKACPTIIRTARTKDYPKSTDQYPTLSGD